MSTYQPNIPTGTVNLDQDYNNLRNNFQALNNVFGVDHTTFDNATAQKGYHKFAHLIPVSTVATNPPDNLPPNNITPTPGFGQVFSAQINDQYDTDEALFFLTGGNKNLQLTSNLLPLQNDNGYTFLPGGIIVQWGTIVIPSQLNYDVDVSYNIPFGTALNFSVYGISLTGTYANVTTSSSGFTYKFIDNTKFHVAKSGSNSVNGCFWIAVGK